MEKENIRGTKLRNINILIVVVTVILSMLLGYVGLQSGNAYRELNEASSEYILLQQSAANLQMGSDYLTDQVRSFVVNGDRKYIDSYFEEAEVTRRRDNAVEIIRNNVKDDIKAVRNLETALSLSNELMYREFYAMRLALEGRGYDLNEYRDEIRNVTLMIDDVSLSNEEKIEKARSMVFDEIYQDYKNKISYRINEVINDALSRTNTLQNESSESFSRMLKIQNLVIFIFVIAMLSILLFIHSQLIRPLLANVRHISAHEELPLNGTYELQFLAKTYNDMMQQNQIDNTKLSFEATHDALTGLYNRKVFDDMRDKDIDNYTMIYIDIDYFKQVNDTYGHEIADKVLQKMAYALHKNFRSEDYPCRIGGDEFAVIMVNVNSNLKHLVSKKIENVNNIMHDTSDGLPECSISCGIAFPDRDNPTGDIYKDADIALYRAKEAGRNNYKIY